MSAAPESARPAGPRSATLFVVVAVFSVQFGNASAASLFERTGPLGAAALRLALAAILLLVVVRPRVGGWNARTWLGAVILGLGLGGMNALIYLSMSEIPIGIAVTIELLGPLAVAAAGIRRLVDVVWVVLALCGVALLGIGPGESVSLPGMLLAAGAAVCWAMYIVASSKLGSRVRGVDGLTVAMVVAACVVVPFGAGDAVAASRETWWLLPVFLAVAVLTSAVPYALEFTALKSMSSRVFGVLSSLGPAVAALAGLVIMRQQLTPLQMLAVAIVTVASAGVVATSRRS